MPTPQPASLLPVKADERALVESEEALEDAEDNRALQGNPDEPGSLVSITYQEGDEFDADNPTWYGIVPLMRIGADLVRMDRFYDDEQTERMADIQRSLAER